MNQQDLSQDIERGYAFIQSRPVHIHRNGVVPETYLSCGIFTVSLRDEHEQDPRFRRAQLQNAMNSLAYYISRHLP